MTDARAGTAGRSDRTAAALLVRRYHEHREMRWRNGGGTTREVAVGPDGSGGSEFDWRVSIAEVGVSGPFSAYPGVDRVIMLVAGTSMLVTVDGTDHSLRPLVPFSFPGDSLTTCRIAGPTRDLNVMTRRGRAVATLDVLGPGADHQVDGGSPLVVVAVSGSVRVTAPDRFTTTLENLDAALWADVRPLTVGGKGAAAAIRIRM